MGQRSDGELPLTGPGLLLATVAEAIDSVTVLRAGVVLGDHYEDLGRAILADLPTQAATPRA